MATLAKLYHVGDALKDGSGDRRGWIVGHFMGQVDPRRTCNVEVKYWHFEKGEGGVNIHPYKRERTAFECTFILEGKVKAWVDGEWLELHGGQYIAIPPLVPNNTVVAVLEPTVGITIKAPSDPNSKELIQPPLDAPG